MEILKDISVLWSLIHTLVMFLFLFESRYPKKKTIVLTLVTMIPLILVNLVLFMVLGLDRYGTLMLLTLSLPSCIVFWLLAKHRELQFVNSQRATDFQRALHYVGLDFNFDD